MEGGSEGDERGELVGVMVLLDERIYNHEISRAVVIRSSDKLFQS